MLSKDISLETELPEELLESLEPLEMQQVVEQPNPVLKTL